MLFILICTIIIPPSTGIDVRHLGIGIRARIFDPAGRETSLLYDGGNVEISCWKISDNEKKEFQLQFLNEKSRSFHYVSLANSNHAKLQYNISINSTAKSKLYQCIGEKVESIAIKILYVLCNPISVKPRRICSNEGEFCHITSENSPECKQLKSDGCLLGPSKGMVSGTQRSQVLPKFNVVCGIGRGTRYGLCQSLVDSPDKAVRFLRTNTGSCDLDFRFYICGKDCRSKKVAEWDFVDVAKTFSIEVRLGKKVQGDATVFCDVAFTKDEKIMSHKVSFAAPKQELYKAVVVLEQLKQLRTPTIADIVCDVTTNKGETILRYQTSLLVFSSDKDLYVSAAKWVGLTNGNQKTYRFIVNVSSAGGLLVCVEKEKGCIATTATPRLLEFKKRRDLTALYVRLFASSPKDRKVLIYEKILNWTGQQLKVKNDTKDSDSESKSKIDSGIGWKIALAVCLVIGIIAVVAAIVVAILWARRRKAKQRQGPEARKGVSLPVLESRSQSKDLDPTQFSPSVETFSPSRLDTTSSFSPKVLKTITPSPSKESRTTSTLFTKQAYPTLSRSVTEYYSSVKPGMNEYDTIYYKEQ